MKHKLFVTACLLLLAGIMISASAQNLTGSWNIDNTVVKKTIDGFLSTKNYDKNQQPDCFAQCPRKIIFSGENITFEFRDGKQASGTYEIQGNKLIRKMSVAYFTYEWELQGSILHLTCKMEYTIDGLSKALEECHFYGTKE